MVEEGRAMVEEGRAMVEEGRAMVGVLTVQGLNRG